MSNITVKPMENKPLVWWNVRRKQLDMDPPYQRRSGVWTTASRAFLIDSIINEFDIPKIYVADFTYNFTLNNPKKLPYAIIDGKQRFQAIFCFFDGIVRLSRSFKYLKNPDLKLAGLSYSEIKEGYPEIIDLFDTYNLSVMSVITEDTLLIQELFRRLNFSKPLNGAEVRNAMPGPAVDAIRQIAQSDFFVKNTSFSKMRMTDFDTAAKVLLFEYREKPVATKRTDLDEFVISVSQDLMGESRIEIAKERVIANLLKMSTVFTENDPLLGANTLLPAYYWFIKQRTNSELRRVREFLSKIEYYRKSMDKRNYDADEINQDILFDMFRYRVNISRPNDAASHEFRSQFLTNWFNNPEFFDTFNTMVQGKSD